MPKAWEFNQDDFTTLQNAMSQLASLAASAPTFLSGLAAARQVLTVMKEAEENRDRAQDDLAVLKKQVATATQAAEVAREIQATAEADMGVTRRAQAALEDNYLSQKAQQESGLKQQLADAQAKMAAELAAAKEEAGKHLRILTSEVDELEKRKTAAEAALKAIKASL